MQDKKEARKICRRKRNAVENLEAKSSAACEIILSSQKISDADTVLVYAAVGSEVKTDLLIDKLLQIGKNVGLPRCFENGIMKFYSVNSRSQLIIDKFDIPAPNSDCPLIDLTENTVCIVPGLAFTENGARLGYGGGFYDRFNAANPEIYTIGLTLEELLVDELPVLPHDMTVNSVATEERKVLCCAE